MTSHDTDRALSVVCPLLFCSAPIGQRCASHVSGKDVPPHQHRLVQAGVIAPPSAPHQSGRDAP